MPRTAVWATVTSCDNGARLSDVPPGGVPGDPHAVAAGVAAPSPASAGRQVDAAAAVRLAHAQPRSLPGQKLDHRPRDHPQHVRAGVAAGAQPHPGTAVDRPVQLGRDSRGGTVVPKDADLRQTADAGRARMAYEDARKRVAALVQRWLVSGLTLGAVKG